jgi:hypothetical protein
MRWVQPPKGLPSTWLFNIYICLIFFLLLTSPLALLDCIAQERAGSSEPGPSKKYWNLALVCLNAIAITQPDHPSVVAKSTGVKIRMKSNHFWSRSLTALSIGALLFAGNASAQTKADKKALLNKFLVNSGKLPAKQKALLSSGMQNFVQIANNLNKPNTKAGIGDDGGTFNGLAQTQAQLASHAVRATALASSIAGPGETTRVSNPALDFLTSVTTGFTQSESSSAWCGNTVVAGYNDSGAFLRTAGVNFLGAWSFNGVSISVNGGKSFVDLGFLNPGSDPANFLSGDPVVTCSSSSEFYYSSIFSTATPPDSSGNRNPLTAIAVNASGNGGLSWGAPIAAVAKDGFAHGLDKPWMTIDPTNPLQLYVTYTDFDFSFPATGTCANDSRIAIELVSSSDGGNRWSAPVVIDEECGASFNGVQGSNVLVSPGGKVYVAFEFIPGLTPDNEIHFRRSLDHGKTFGKTVVIASDVVPNGADGALQAGFRNNEFPQLAVDRTNGSSRGTIYVAWSDGKDNVIPDIESFTGTYAFPDIVVAKSTDFGASFSTPNAVSPTPASFTGLGRDQFFPGIAVDKDGKVGVCYYDRRNDSENTVIDRYCSVSHNHGATWSEERVSSSNWLPLHSSDLLINPTYIGDYDAITTDFLLGSSGFFGTFEIQINGNPDVLAKKF